MWKRVELKRVELFVFIRCWFFSSDGISHGQLLCFLMTDALVRSGQFLRCTKVPPNGTQFFRLNAPRPGAIFTSKPTLIVERL